MTVYAAAPWYTNPQTVALCDFIGITNRINAPPPAPVSVPILQHQASPPAPSAFGPRAVGPPGLVPPQVSEREEIRRIEAAAQAAMERKASSSSSPAASAGPAAEMRCVAVEEEGSSTLVTLLDEDDDGLNARWKEGTG